MSQAVAKARRNHADFTALQRRIRGTIHLPGEEAYQDACRIWNAMIEKRPALVVRPSGSEDVAETVRFAAQAGLPLSVRGGGHNVAGAALADGGITIDMSQQRGVNVDPGTQRVVVEPGATWKDVDAATQPHALIVPSGIISATGVAGFTLGAGFGWTSRKFGFAADNLAKVEVVTADGRVLQASESENADLFWALRGGSGNFGVVTRFEFNAHKHGPKALCGLAAHPGEKAADVIRLFRDVTADAPDELTCLLILRNALPAPFIPQEFHGKPIAGIMAHWTGDPVDGEEAMRRIKSFGTPIFDTMSPKDFVAFQTALDGGQPFGRRYYWKSDETSEISDGIVGALAPRTVKIPSPFSAVLVMHMGGAASRVPADATAVGIRSAHYSLVVQGAWEKAEEDKQHIGWAREVHTALKPFSSSSPYVNFLTEDEVDDRVRKAFASQTFRRLREVKSKYDAQNLFRGNLNIPPL
jgi:hypothetical protein